MNSNNSFDKNLKYNRKKSILLVKYKLDSKTALGEYITNSIGQHHQHEHQHQHQF